MEGFLDSLDQALREKNWYSALVMSLTLPDVCAKAAAPGKTSGKKYAAWFDEFVGSKYRRPVGAHKQMHTFLSGKDCYALRCALLHEGTAEIATQSAREVLDRFYFCTPGPQGNRWHQNQVGGALLLMVDEFAADILEAARSWWASLEPAQQDAVRKAQLVLLDADRIEGC
ncbi:hypothetical protein [Streptomyces californicus]|uniref:hypothetical protein n=1 Tax=Streptomyces californicus TaxID=67351 RepID=UPI00380FAE61